MPWQLFWGRATLDAGRHGVASGYLDAGIDYWRQWYFEWDASPGQHFIACRATTKDGEVQPDVLVRWAANAPLAMPSGISTKANSPA